MSLGNPVYRVPFSPVSPIILGDYAYGTSPSNRVRYPSDKELIIYKIEYDAYRTGPLGDWMLITGSNRQPAWLTWNAYNDFDELGPFIDVPVMLNAPLMGASLVLGREYRFLIHYIFDGVAGNWAFAYEHVTGSPGLEPDIELSICGVMGKELDCEGHPGTSRVVWSTNLPATSKVWYTFEDDGMGNPINWELVLDDRELILCHDFLIPILAVDTLHYFKLESTNGYDIVYGEGVFCTGAIIEFATGQFWFSSSVSKVTASDTAVSVSSLSTLTGDGDGISSSTFYVSPTPVIALAIELSETAYSLSTSVTITPA